MTDDELNELFRETMDLLAVAEQHIAEALRLLNGPRPSNVIPFPVRVV